MAKESYVQLTYQDRLYISRLNARKMSVSEIARRVGVRKSTISRELRGNGGVTDVESQLFYAEMTLLGEPKDVLRKHLKELRDYAMSPETRKWVIQKLKEHWSPEQIAGRSEFEASEPVSYEFVYRLLHEDHNEAASSTGF